MVWCTALSWLKTLSQLLHFSMGQRACPPGASDYATVNSRNHRPRHFSFVATQQSWPQPGWLSDLGESCRSVFTAAGFMTSGHSHRESTYPLVGHNLLQAYTSCCKHIRHGSTEHQSSQLMLSLLAISTYSYLQLSVSTGVIIWRTR